jgi:hypothetical protein
MPSKSIMTVDIDIEEIDDRLELIKDSIESIASNLSNPQLTKIVSFT